MSIEQWMLYLSMVIVATITPGPAIFFIMSNSIIYGKKYSLTMAFGNIVGLFVLGVIAITGLGILLSKSELLFTSVKYAGAIYLIYLGVKMILDNKDSPVISIERSIVHSHTRLFYESIGIALSNPKAIIFLMALFPQFIEFNKPILLQFLTLITVLMFSSFSFLLCYALLAFRAKKILDSPSKLVKFKQYSGMVFVLIGSFLIIATVNSN